jgi:hypothetical protein
MNTDEAMHSIVRILKKLHADTGSMVTQVVVDWNVLEKTVLHKESVELRQVQLVAGIRAGQAQG